MPVDLYEIQDEYNNLIATNLSLTNACLLIKAIFNEYYNDLNMSLTIKRMSSWEENNVEQYI